MQIYGIFTENRGKYVKNRGNARKIGEFPRNPFLEVAEPKEDPAVVSGRFCGHSWRKSENFGEYRRKMENIGDIFPFSFRFYSFLFLFIPQPLDFLPQMLNLT